MQTLLNFFKKKARNELYEADIGQRPRQFKSFSQLFTEELNDPFGCILEQSTKHLKTYFASNPSNIADFCEAFDLVLKQ